MKALRLAFLAALAGPCAAAASPAGDIAGTWECRQPGIEYRNKPPILYVAETGGEQSQVTIEVDATAILFLRPVTPPLVTRDRR